MLGYYLREALTIAEKMKIEPYHELKSRFRIRDLGDRVVAELTKVESLTALQTGMAKMTLPGLTELFEIIGAAITHGANEMYFSEAELLEEEVGKLFAWATKNGYHLVVGEGITLTKTDPGEAKWLPESTSPTTPDTTTQQP